MAFKCVCVYGGGVGGGGDYIHITSSKVVQARDDITNQQYLYECECGRDDDDDVVVVVYARRVTVTSCTNML